MRFGIVLLILFYAYSSNAQKIHSTDHQIDGQWIVEFHSADIGVVRTVFDIETKGSSFEAWTRKGATRDILGFWKSMLAKIFTNDFKNGTLLRIEDGIRSEKKDTVVLSGIFRSAMGNYYFNGEIVNDHLEAVLKDGNLKQRGTLSGNRAKKISMPLDDYSKIVSEAIDTAKKKIYNRKELETKDWKKFERKISKKAPGFEDDVELVFAFYYFASSLPFSHFALTRLEQDKSQLRQSKKKQYLFLEEKNNQTAILRITSFGGSTTEVDSVFSVIHKNNYDNLIVDLRNNSGGTVEAGMAFARNVIDTSLTGGFFLTQNWFNEHDLIPNQEQLDQLPKFSEANYELIIQGIHREKGLRLKVEPSEINFNGNLYIITNRSTASTCEPIVHGLKAAGRATIVGEKTAGAMLNGERFNLSSGFSLFVPTADYYTMDGYRIDQNGVDPNIMLKDEDPVDFIIEQLIE